MAAVHPSSRSPKSPGRLNRVFVDFENVPSVDLGLIGDQPVEAILFIGVKQQRFDLALVRQIHEHAAKVTLIEVGTSGRNALDLVLAWHLGKTAERYPKDLYFVVSKDRDFDPLIAHLHAQDLTIERVEAFSSLPCLARTSTPRRTPTPPISPPAVAIKSKAKTERAKERIEAPPAAKDETDSRLAKIIDRLQHKTNARPVRRKTLLTHINGFYKNLLSPADLEAIVTRLQARGVIAIDPKGRVSYP